jgi:tetratricopeptide (TPR) repeat protein
MHSINSKSIFLIVTPFLVAVLLLMPANGAVVVLKTGERINGLILSKTESAIEISVRGNPAVYQMQDIKEIRGRQVLSQELAKKEIEKTVASDFEKALSRAAEGEFEEAAQMFEKIVEDYPSLTNAKEALSMCNDAISGKTSRDYALCVLEARQQILKGNYALAIVLFQKALKLNPNAVELYYDLGCAHQLLGENEMAVSYFKKINELNPNDPDILFKLGSSLHALGKYQEALPHFEALKVLTPTNPQVFTFLGTSYQALGQIEKGNEYLRKAKALFAAEGETLNSQETDELVKK